MLKGGYSTMYKIIKDRGYYSVVTLVNTEAKSSIMIGKLDTDIVCILTEAGHRVEVGHLDPHDAWDLTVNSETATKLYNLTMKMRKPIRKQVKREPSVINQQDEPDLFDVLFGLASYKD